MCGPGDEQRGLVILVDDDDAVRAALTLLFRSYGWCVVAFGSARAFLAASRVAAGRCCLVVDHQMPELTGLDLLARLRDAGHDMPVVFMTGRVDGLGRIKASARLHRPVALLDKPLDPDDLVGAVRAALAPSV